MAVGGASRELAESAGAAAAPGFWMTQLQALAISSRLASSGYWFSRKKLGGGQTDNQSERSPISLGGKTEAPRGMGASPRPLAVSCSVLGWELALVGGEALREDCVIPPDYSECSDGTFTASEMEKSIAPSGRSSRGRRSCTHLSMMDWHSFLQVNLLPRRSLRGPPTSPLLSPAISPVLQSGSSFTRERMDSVAPGDESVGSRLNKNTTSHGRRSQMPGSTHTAGRAGLQPAESRRGTPRSPVGTL